MEREEKVGERESGKAEGTQRVGRRRPRARAGPPRYHIPGKWQDQNGPFYSATVFTSYYL
eukprot:scaffold309019_cov18-Tisochrysis_lutea.AAC.1